ncbi:MAG: CatB-related O-acetyltransferase, partial [Gallionella sp.]|nr:CatB-related O-acetyltransferase [Gallionella sp.]
PPGGAQIGCYSYGESIHIHCDTPGTKLYIGNYCSLAADVQFFLGEEHNLDWGTTYPFSVFPKDWMELRSISGHPMTRGDIVVGNDVWIGYGALIRSGVTVGDGAVIGMGAVVTRDVPPYAIAAGNPAKILRYRFAPAIVEALRAIAWWNLPQPVVRRIAPLLCSPIDPATLAELQDAVHDLGCGDG